MFLKRVEIKNFRSIDYVQIPFDQGCEVLVGINESGKSNILKALRLLSKDYDPKEADVRLARDNEPEIHQSFVLFVFGFEERDIEQIFGVGTKRFAASGVDAPMFIDKKTNRILSFEEYCRRNPEVIYRADIKSETKRPSRWATDANFDLVEGWRTPAAVFPTDLMVNVNGRMTDAFGLTLIEASSYREIESGFLEPASIEHALDLFWKPAWALMEENLPSCIFWDYSPEKNLPAQISLSTFQSNLDSCLPLKNMFELAGISEISTEIESRLSKPPHVFRALLNKVASRTTAHLRAIWKDYTGIRVDLNKDGDNIVVTIAEESEDKALSSTPFDFASRSDGFKRFVSFLLLISTRVKAEKLSNTLLLMDEPEISLHPSGARHLMLELIDIANRGNYVAFSTHSIHMIDKENIGRHLLVRKKNEITTAMVAGVANVADEEVIFQAIGYSIFETLKARNIVFEGWKDKKLFQIAANHLASSSSEIKVLLNKTGLCHSKGVKDAHNVATFMELANRKCVIVSDNDAPAKEKQKLFKQERRYGSWYRYPEIIENSIESTGEDYIKPSAFLAPCNAFRTKYPNLADITEAQIITEQGTVGQIKAWLQTANVPVNDIPAVLESIKDSVFTNLRIDHVRPSYFPLAERLLSDDFWLAH